jgi:hypothetical protein
MTFEMVGDDYTEAPGPGEAIMQAVGSEGAFSSEYRAYPVEGSAVLGIDLNVKGIEQDGVRPDAIAQAHGEIAGGAEPEAAPSA